MRRAGWLFGGRDQPVVIAMVAVGMMEMALDQIVNVVTVRHGWMAADGAMHVVGGVFRRGKAGRALGRVGSGHRKGVLVVMAIVRMMQMTGIQVIHVAVVKDGQVTTIRTVLVRVVGMAGMRVFRLGAGNGKASECCKSEDECFVHGIAG